MIYVFNLILGDKFNMCSRQIRPDLYARLKPQKSSCGLVQRQKYQSTRQSNKMHRHKPQASLFPIPEIQIYCSGPKV